ncbi:MAG TPA: WbqC family protein [Chitinophagaceae bacterium]|nr:WbqC family protein [Chitinophagaceae bacterium]HPH30278.1 WbqC family protein [Chitinophagaceae bacterium]HPN57764.1 WbqC family protein [Chitinophagaceae bacterium]
MKKVAISQSNYIPWKGYFDAINEVDEFMLFDDMQYTKRDWRNRNKIKTKEGAKWLTVPVEVKGKYFQKINETLISDPKWGQDHWNSILHNYNKAPFFKDYKDIFEPLYLASQEDHLSLVNYNFIKAICEILGITTKISWSSAFELKEDRNERLVDLCMKTGATDYYSGPAAKAYMDVSLFEKENIQVHYYDYSGYPVYNQLHGEFDHAVSILDLLFCEGPESKKYMKTFVENEK